MTMEIIRQLALSLGLGLLVGFQREWAAPHVAGVRTFTLLTLFGTLCGLLAEAVGFWLVPTGLVISAGLLIMGTFIQLKSEADARWERHRNRDAETDEEAEQTEEIEPPGLTTHVAACLMFLVGASLVFMPVELSILIAGGVAVLLHWKGPIHWFIGRLGEKEVRGIMQLVLLALIILPLMPDQTLPFDPYQVLNPYDIWRLVVLICGISLVGYIAARFLGQTASIWMSGILGGVISSTATTVTFSRQSRRLDQPTSATLIIMIASTVVFGRVLFEVILVAPEIVVTIWMPMAALTILMSAITLGFRLFRPLPEEISSDPIESDPTQLPTALVFGTLYAVVLFGVAAAKDQFGNAGLYVVSALSGLTDMDAITLSTARLMQEEQIDIDIGWRMIAIGFLANLVFKLGIVFALASRPLKKQVALVFSLAFVGGVLIVAFWPSIH